MISLPIGRKWKQPKSKSESKTNESIRNSWPSMPDWMLGGVGLCASLLLVLLLSGCASQTVVREPCKPYPEPPASLMKPPLNLHLVPKEQLPPKPVSRLPTTQ